MKDHEIDCFDVNDGKLIYTKSKVKAPISKKHLLTCLSDYFTEDKQQVEKLSNLILDSRKEKINETIRRKMN